jgi:hypothetical protein
MSKGKSEALVKAAQPWIESLARMGYLAKGVVYLMIGIMTALFAFGKRSQPADFSTVLLQIIHQPFGEIMLGLLTIGLFGYGLWCFVQAFMDTEKKGNTVLGILIRFFYGVVGIMYCFIGWSALRLLMKVSRLVPGDRPEQELTATVFRTVPGARWLAVIVGLGLLGFCVNEIRRLYAQGYEILRPRGGKRIIDELAMRVGQIGITGRAIVLAIIGFSLIWSGITFDPAEVRGISGALREVQQQPHGIWLLTATAIGLFAYGAYMILLAWRRRIDPTE